MSSCYRVVELLQPTDCQEAVHAHAVFYEQLDKIHPVHHERIQHCLLQRAHLNTQTEDKHAVLKHTFIANYYL